MLLAGGFSTAGAGVLDAIGSGTAVMARMICQARKRAAATMAAAFLVGATRVAITALAVTPRLSAGATRVAMHRTAPPRAGPVGRGIICARLAAHADEYAKPSRTAAH